VSDYEADAANLTKKLLHENVKSLFDYRCVISGADQVYVISLGVGLLSTHFFGVVNCFIEFVC